MPYHQQTQSTAEFHVRQRRVSIFSNYSFLHYVIAYIFKISLLSIQGMRLDAPVLSLHENIPLLENDRGRMRRCLGILRDHP